MRNQAEKKFSKLLTTYAIQIAAPVMRVDARRVNAGRQIGGGAMVGYRVWEMETSSMEIEGWRGSNAVYHGDSGIN